MPVAARLRIKIDEPLERLPDILSHGFPHSRILRINLGLHHVFRQQESSQLFVSP